MSRPCEICGARVTNMNPKTTTCSSVCKRAKRNGLSRELQVKRDIRQEEKDERLGYWHSLGYYTVYR
jgi:hypothetical protein